MSSPLDPLPRSTRSSTDDPGLFEIYPQLPREPFQDSDELDRSLSTVWRCASYWSSGVHHDSTYTMSHTCELSHHILIHCKYIIVLNPFIGFFIYIIDIEIYDPDILPLTTKTPLNLSIQRRLYRDSPAQNPLPTSNGNSIELIRSVCNIYFTWIFRLFLQITGRSYFHVDE